MENFYMEGTVGEQNKVMSVEHDFGVIFKLSEIRDFLLFFC